ncbi:MAG: RimK family alpha-L-glutamate ligase [Patescibacteria group bacterium]|nr:RimK family alpha-L-glutamate ligase [Patescibacteria group bacterium]
MHVGILSFRPQDGKIAYEESRLVKAARELGYKGKVYRAYDCELYYNGGGPTILYKGKPFPKIDVMIPRVSVLNNVDLSASVVKQLELMGVPVLNSYNSILKAKNKLRTLQIMSHYNLPIPKTVVIGKNEDLKEAIKKVGGAPVIIKSPFGSLGSGVMIVESYRAAVSTVDFFGSKIVLIQEYVKESKGKDTRVFVVGGKVVAAMERTAKKGEFRSNAALGGKGRIVSLDKEYEDLALKASGIMGLDVAGVDILTTKNGPVILEVNSNPGFEELEKATGIDVAKAMVERAVGMPVI